MLPPLPPGLQIVREITGPRGRIARVEWLDDNRVLLSASEDGFLRRWDVEVGKGVGQEREGLEKSGAECWVLLSASKDGLLLRWSVCWWVCLGEVCM